MTDSQKVEKERKIMTERILNLTLEIIYLLTGENNIVAKKASGDEQDPITVPLHSLLVPERKNEEKILQITQKITDVLIGESGNWSNFNVGSKENIKEGEQEPSVMEGQKDLYKDVVMKNQPPLTSPAGSSNRKPPKRRPRPRNARKSTQTDRTIPHHDKGEEVMGIKIVIKEEEEMFLIDDQLSLNENEILETKTQEESSIYGSTVGQKSRNTPEGRLILPANYNKDDVGMALCSPGKSIVAKNLHRQLNLLNCEKAFSMKPDQAFLTLEKPFVCPQCGKAFLRKSGLVQHLRIHTGVKPCPCPICGKCFIDKSQLNRHNKVHSGERPFPCPQCGKCFSHKGNRDKHIIIHTGLKPFSCFQCGKCFVQKVSLILHQKTHTTT